MSAHSPSRPRWALARRLATAGLLGLSLVGCTNLGTRLSELGEVPSMTKTANPTATPGYQPVTAPVPNPQPTVRQVGSIWQPGARAFFKDQRASRVGDVVTVDISIDDSANLNNETQGARNDTDKIGATNLLGLESILPAAITASSLVNTSGVRSTDGKGQIQRSEKISLKVAAMVTQVLPNGNMVVVGNQQVRVNYDLRDLKFTGVIRPNDIDALNTITWEKIAEARISYGGRGQSEDLQQPRLGSQLIDTLSPF